MKRSALLFVVLLCSAQHKAQKWVEMIGQKDANFYEIQKEFYNYYKDKDITVKGIGYKQFKRWEYLVSPRVYPSGDLSVMNQSVKNYEEFLRNYNQEHSGNKSSSSALSATWMPVGPMGAPSGSAFGLPTAAGKDNAITFHPTNNQTFYACSGNGGLWETNNGGVSWSTNHDQLPKGACSDLVIDPSNTNIMYLATGGGDNQLSGDPAPSLGIYKTSNAGVSWAATGFTFTATQSRYIHKLAIDPSNTQVVFAATNAGIFRSTNGGTSWISVSTVACWDVEFHPTNPSIVYAAGNTSFYRSTNGGSSFTVVSSGIPTSGAQRMRIAVTPANPSCVYVLACKSSDSNYMGVYKSVDNGVTFVTSSTSPNILGNACAGNSTGTGTAWWSMALAASPTNSNEIVVGGVNVWRSTNGGVNWTNIGCWNAPSNLYVHADIHELEYAPNGTLYTANDGGLFSFNGISWTALNGQRNIAEMYRIGLSALTPNLWLTGHQDNGTSKKNGANYTYVVGGDGMDCFIDRTNDLNMFAQSQNGALRRSTNGGSTWNTATTGLTGTPGWLTPWKQDPLNSGTIYCGYSTLFKSTNLGASWTQLGNTGGSGTVVEFAVAPSNNQVIYVLQGSIRKTTNGGSTWTSANFTGGVPTYITVDPSDENTAWVTVSGYTAGSKVFQTVDGGATWMNVSTNLPNLPANCSVYEPGSNDRIYIGMDIGVYYKDNSSPNWTLYNAGLPNLAVMDLEMTPAVPGQLFAATWGRGVYQADAVQTTAAPSPSFSYYGALCVGTDKVLIDNSSNSPSSWTWTITPNTGVTFNSTSVQNPTLSFTSPGTYTVSMASGNSFGMGPVYTSTIGVYTTPTLVLTSANSVTLCEAEPLSITASGAVTYTWSNGGGNNASVVYSPSINWTYTVTGSNNGCMSRQTVAVAIETCLGINEQNDHDHFFSVYPNPANDKLNILSTGVYEVSLVLMDVSGKIIKEQNAVFKKEKNEFQLNISALAKGVYFLKINSKEGVSQTIKFLKE